MDVRRVTIRQFISFSSGRALAEVDSAIESVTQSAYETLASDVSQNDGRHTLFLMAGLDGVGKTTLARSLTTLLKKS